MEHQKGFTLVELAIALTVIGLLIVGVLKGQELIENTKVVASMRDIQGYETAVAIFHDTYEGLPGDIINAGTRLLNCTGVCAIDGNQDDVVGHHFTGEGEYVFSNEHHVFWFQLYAAGLISKIGEDRGFVSAATLELGGFPPFPLGGTIDVRYRESPIPFNIWPEGIKGHHWIFRGSIPTRTIQRMDIKMDDANPVTGVVRVASSHCGFDISSTEYMVSGVTPHCPVLVMVDNF